MVFAGKGKGISISIPFLISFFNLLYAQEVQTTDATTLEAIGYVAITHLSSGQSILTDMQGKADLGLLPEKGYFSFRHPAYAEQILSHEVLQNQNFRVLLFEELVSIDEVVVSANRWEQQSTEVPNQLVSISPKEITLGQPQTAAEMLAQSGQVFVQKSQQGGGSPMLRGFAANSLLLVFDGVRLNNAIYRSGNLHNLISVNPLILEGSEVIFGPGSVLYGSDALGGVIDFHTQPVLLNQDSFYIQSNALLRYSSANNEQSLHADVRLGKGRWGYLGSFSYADFDDLRAGSNRPEEDPDFGKRLEYVQRFQGRDSVFQNDDADYQRFSGYQLYSSLHKLRYALNRNNFLSYSFYLSSTSDMPRYDRLIQRTENKGRDGALRNAVWYYGPQQWLQHNLQWLSLGNSNFYNQARLTFGWQDYTESRHDRRLNASKLRHRTEKVDQLTLNADFELGPLPRMELFYGIEAVTDWVRSSAYAENIESGEITDLSTRYPDGGSSYYTLAAYAYAKHHLNQELWLNGGVRYTYTGLNAQFNALPFESPLTEITLTNDALNGSLSFIYHPQEKVKLSLLGSSGFRAPNVDDVAKVFDSEPGNVVVPNPNLQPEFSYNTEFSVDYRPAKPIQLQATLFRTWLKDAMVRRDFLLNGKDSVVYDGTYSKVEAIVNAGHARIWGYSLGFLALLPAKVKLAAFYNDQYGTEGEEEIPLRHVPPAFGRVQISKETKRFTISASWEFSKGYTFDELAPSEQDKAYLYSHKGSLGWSVFNLRGQYQLSQVLSLKSGLENIFDLHYRTYSSGISAPGRNFYIALQATL